MTTLADAHRELVDRYRIADDVGDWQERSILGPLADVADYVKRVGDHPDSTHYRADKSGALLQAALRLHREALMAYAGWPEGDEREIAIDKALDMLQELTTQLVGVSWLEARGEPLHHSQAVLLTAGARQFARWAEGLATTALPDPVD